MTDGLQPPPPEDQLDFLQKLQRILEEGQFVASYKFALLHALADLAVLHGRDTGDALVLGTDMIAERFVELYWAQARPFPGRTGSAVPRQNIGRQAAILSFVETFQRKHGPRLGEARRTVSTWRTLVRKVQRKVEEMPLWKLQVVGRAPVEFLYPNKGKGDHVFLLPGVAFCLRRFHALVVELARSGWVRYVRANNNDLLGNATELEEFLFGAERSSLAAYPPILGDFQNGRCFYCRAALRSIAEVDHFIPWVLYPTDLGHNFVLACRACNGDKQDRLAACSHLRSWSMRNRDLGAALTDAFRQAGLPFNLAAMRRIAFWAYGRLEASGGLCWQGDVPKPKRMVNLAPEWRQILEEAELQSPAGATAGTVSFQRATPKLESRRRSTSPGSSQPP
jgi:5-methylcytosine-specific restriction endonuclease McrA